MKFKRSDILFLLGVLSAIWFAITGMVWVYFAALIISYPIGIISYVLWRTIKPDNNRRNVIIPIVLTIGLTLSLATLVYLLIWD